MENTVPVRSEKQQSPKKARHFPPDPASPKGIPPQMRFSTPPVTEKRKVNATGSASPYIPSPAPPFAEDETFMFATRHALENALGKETLERLEVILQREKKLTKDYIEYLEEAVKQRSEIKSQIQNALVEKEIAHWKAKAEGHSENTKTEMRLLRDWNVRIKEDRDALEEEVKQLRRENGMLRAETERLKCGNDNEKGLEKDENKKLRMRNAELEAENDTTNANFQMMQESFVALKAQVERTKNDFAPEHKQEESEVKMKQSHGIADSNGNASASVSKNYKRNLRRKATEKRRRERDLAQEQKQSSAKLAQLKSEYAVAHAATLAAKEEHLVKLQAKVQDLEREIRSRDERVERKRGTSVPTPAAMSTSTSASKRKNKKRKMKKKMKRKQKAEKEMNE